MKAVASTSKQKELTMYKMMELFREVLTSMNEMDGPDGHLCSWLTKNGDVNHQVEKQYVYGGYVDGCRMEQREVQYRKVLIQLTSDGISAVNLKMISAPYYESHDDPPSTYGTHITQVFETTLDPARLIMDQVNKTIRDIKRNRQLTSAISYEQLEQMKDLHNTNDLEPHMLKGFGVTEQLQLQLGRQEMAGPGVDEWNAQLDDNTPEEDNRT